MGVNGRVLSIQSSVVSGYVGNKSAVFPLQLLGFEVDIINSVQFSNHTGYRQGWTGQKLSGEELLDLIEGMKSNDLLHHISHLLTGYVGTESFLRTLLEVHQTLVKVNPGLIFVCDPVLGDDGVYYTERGLATVYREEVLPQADIITPNAFELGVLTGEDESWGSEPRTKKEVFEACLKLHKLGPKTVIVTSSISSETQFIMAYASRVSKTQDREMFTFEIERIPAHFTGSGDLTAAVVLAHLTGSNPRPLMEACEYAFSTTAAILSRTYEHGNQGMAPMAELELIGSQHLILKPPLTVKAQEWSPH
ncbi:hypothetical protein NDN08_000807 [Rhodosorus marinus]|uniref:pyridoxal kinase n=1 Tax=Rhodosorus marinus TaxID=101924 RepID=A0AAV8UQK5_9RHOD|nr:hypothetical protein NDN08_000807 [Rhodosorus marinus]